MNIQSSIMAREVLVTRLATSEERQAKSRETLNGITSEFFREIYYEDQWSDDPRPSINPHWSFDASHKVSYAIGELSKDQISKADSIGVDSARQDVIQLAKALEGCLDAIHAPDSSDLTDSDFGLTNEDIAEIGQKADAAKADLPKKIEALAAAASNLDSAFSKEVDRLRRKIRDIDRLVVDDQTG